MRHVSHAKAGLGGVSTASTHVHAMYPTTTPGATGKSSARGKLSSPAGDGAGCRVQGAGFRVQGAGCRVWRDEGEGEGGRFMFEGGIVGVHAAHLTRAVHGAPCHARPFEPSIKSQFLEILTTFGDKCPQNGSKNEQTAPRTNTGYPHIGPFVASQSTEWIGASLVRKRPSPRTNVGP